MGHCNSILTFHLRTCCLLHSSEGGLAIWCIRGLHSHPLQHCMSLAGLPVSCSWPGLHLGLEQSSSAC